MAIWGDTTVSDAEAEAADEQQLAEQEQDLQNALAVRGRGGEWGGQGLLSNRDQLGGLGCHILLCVCRETVLGVRICPRLESRIRALPALRTRTTSSLHGSRSPSSTRPACWRWCSGRRRGARAGGSRRWEGWQAR